MLLIAAVLIFGRRLRVREKKRELALILGAGYGAVHRTELKKRDELFEDGRKTCGLKVPPKKRPLSKEAREILELVEEQKKAERKAENKAVADGCKQGMNVTSTGIMEERQKNKEKTRPTGVLIRNPGKTEDSTGIMAERRPGKKTKERTDIISRRNGRTRLPERETAKAKMAAYGADETTGTLDRKTK